MLLSPPSQVTGSSQNVSTNPFNPYEVLGVNKNDPIEVIALAFRRAAARAHPDRQGGSKERMTDVNMAWDILKDPAMRARYDSGQDLGVPPLEARAREFIMTLARIAIENSTVDDDLIFILRAQVEQQHNGLVKAREETVLKIAKLRTRLLRLKGPKENFLETMLLQQVKRQEDLLPTYDEDEEVQAKAIEMLKDFRYLMPFVMDLNLEGFVPIHGHILAGPNG